MNCDELGHHWDISLALACVLHTSTTPPLYYNVVLTIWCFAQAHKHITHVQIHNHIQVNCVYHTFWALIWLLFACSAFFSYRHSHTHFEHLKLLYYLVYCIIVSRHIGIMPLSLCLSVYKFLLLIVYISIWICFLFLNLYTHVIILYQNLLHTSETYCRLQWHGE